MPKKLCLSVLLAALALAGGAAAQSTSAPVSWKSNPQDSKLTYTFNGCQRINRLDVICSVNVAFTPDPTDSDQRGYQLSAVASQAAWSVMSNTAQPVQANLVQTYSPAVGRSKLDYGALFYNVVKDAPVKLSYMFRAAPAAMTVFPELTLLGHRQIGVAIRPLTK
ncbi:hypothetical protein [Deinococcus koreensis]|uniref:Uncharacterized protein n=1 Tax=Deinococcus koreensis TaxID=2054903 RepID=A0A2K3V1T2_9DEIO|nr:hypothetical protein [Deinococcus koreensis]PNY82752.1 hypothetical protein CVO96_16570 [Deinococcus koreensis]